MTPIESRRKRTFEQFRDSQEDVVVQGRQEPQQPVEPVAQSPTGLRRYLSNTLAWGKRWYSWATNKTVGQVTIDLPAQGRIEEQNNKRRFVVPGAWPLTPSPERRQTPRRQATHPVEPASPTPAPRQRPQPAAVEMQPSVEVGVDLESTPAVVTPVTTAERSPLDLSLIHI